ncbi:SAM-dependent methyltransferase [Pseudomonas sp. AOB-7]|uniref:class I SAM-dependent methyltransferase n=1 Tax=Pseudomonas sp. AOB-7 TaxID=2482750 RepID=UPI000EFCFD83|nr:class I SAM-dependent methyltransferase [Pseudomonas sp. AOB-7]RMH82264.1 SAM-dependent methyltransferase [Pseudomonas sp. AOB-7]
MFSVLKRLFSKQSPIHAAHPERSESEAPLDDFALVDACLSGWFNTDTGELLQGFPIRPEDRVLDVGCGEGPFTHFCAKMKAEVIFADIDPERVCAVEKLLQGSPARALHPLVTDGNPLPLPDAHLDKIIAMEVLEHVDVPADFMRELVRVGKPGALYLLTVPDAASEGVQQQLAPAAHFMKPNHINIFSRDDFERLVLDAGLVIERRTYYGFYWAVWWAFFWVCKKDLAAPDHPLLNNWARTWAALLQEPGGAQVKQALDGVMPKSQAIIARKPLES